MEFSINEWNLFPSIQLMDDGSRALSEYLPKDELQLTLLRSSPRHPGQVYRKPANKEPNKEGTQQALANMTITFRTRKSYPFPN
jgi:hypothetical protein